MKSILLDRIFDEDKIILSFSSLDQIFKCFVQCRFCLNFFENPTIATLVEHLSLCSQSEQNHQIELCLEPFTVPNYKQFQTEGISHIECKYFKQNQIMEKQRCAHIGKVMDSAPEQKLRKVLEGPIIKLYWLKTVKGRTTLTLFDLQQNNLESQLSLQALAALNRVRVTKNRLISNT